MVKDRSKIINKIQRRAKSIRGKLADVNESYLA